MDDKNWDIGWVVRSSNVNRPNNVVAPNLGLKPQTFENDDENFLDRLLGVDMTGFEELAEIFSRDFEVARQKNPNDQSSKIINPTTSIHMIVDQIKIMNQKDNQQLLQPILEPAQLSQQIFLPSPRATLAYMPAVTVAPQEWIDLQQQFVMQANVNTNLTFPMRTPVIQTCKRKNQEIKFIYELRQEELTNDTWRWRKYGQKPIKSSPFLRNYYKCCTSKDCRARKQIEKIPNEENLFLVAYSGVHNHPPPTNRSSLPGSDACFKSKLPRGINTVPRALSLNSPSKHSKCSRITMTAAENNDVAIVEETVVLIPNKFVNEDILKGFEELNGVTSLI